MPLEDNELLTSVCSYNNRGKECPAMVMGTSQSGKLKIVYWDSHREKLDTEKYAEPGKLTPIDTSRKEGRRYA